MDLKRRRGLARVLSALDSLGPADPLPKVENSRPIGQAYRIGVTGPLGAGKSTLINEIVRNYRSRALTVGIIAVDPTSPFTGGAVLGDRVRMTDLVMDEGVFIRSLATRGLSGGLAATTVDAADVLDMYGFDRIIIESVGVGQTEVDIMEVCDCIAVVLEPAAGDGIQAIKAGLMEIADLFIVNKKDLRGADRYIQDLKTAIELRSLGRQPEVLATLARTGDGIIEVCEWLENFWNIARKNNIEGVRSKQRADRVRRSARDAVVKLFWDSVSAEKLMQLSAGGRPVREIAHTLVQEFLNYKVSK